MSCCQESYELITKAHEKAWQRELIPVSRSECVQLPQAFLEAFSLIFHSHSRASKRPIIRNS